MARIAIILVLVIASLTSCRQSIQTNQPVDGYQVSFEVDPATPIVGESRVVITILDESGNPVDNARVEIRGDMAHAGMVPVLATAEGRGSGHYDAAFEWTMAGDWVVMVSATLPDGRTIEREFPITVQSR